jgi:hypothetical protein
MDTQPDRFELIGQLFSQQNCWMIEDLSHRIGSAVISIRRYLKQIGYFRSYSHNGKWYTLQTIPVFNKDGIWLYNDIGFSKHGNLTQTIIHLINQSASGSTAKQLANKLFYPCHSILTNMYKSNLIERIKVSTQFSYLSVDHKIYQRQLKELKIQTDKKQFKPLSSEAAVFVLVEFVKHPQASFQSIAASVKKKNNISVSPEDIDQFFQLQGIKKMPGS